MQNSDDNLNNQSSPNFTEKKLESNENLENSVKTSHVISLQKEEEILPDKNYDNIDAEDKIFEENIRKYEFSQKNRISQFFERNRKKFTIFSIILIILSLLGIGIFASQFFNFGREKKSNEPNLEILIQKAEIPSESTFPWKIQVKNDGKTEMLESQVVVQFSTKNVKISKSNLIFNENLENYIFEIGNIKIGGKKDIILESEVSNFPGENLTIFATLSYKISGTDSKFEYKISKSVDIVRPIVLSEISSFKQNFSNGEKINLELVVENKEKNNFKDLTVQFSTPKDFQIDEESLPENFEKNDENEKETIYFWTIKDLIGEFKTNRTISGKIYGKDSEEKIFGIEVGKKDKEGSWIKFSNDSTILKIASAVLNVQLKINEKTDFINLSPNQNAKFLLEIQNKGSDKSKNLVTEIEFPNYFDLASIKGINPQISGRKVLITSKDIPKFISLESQEIVSTEFEISIVSDVSKIKNFEKNITFEISAKVFESENQNEASESNSVKINLNSSIKFQIDKAFFYRTSSDFPENSGPIPPRVNQKTTYVISWVLETGSNNLKDVVITDILPSGVTYEGKAFTSKGNLNYNPISRKITWSIPEIFAYTGTLKADEVLECWFVVSINPTISDLGETITLNNGAKIISTDKFTNEKIENTGKMHDTSIPEDIEARRENLGGIVIE